MEILLGIAFIVLGIMGIKIIDKSDCWFSMILIILILSLEFLGIYVLLDGLSSIISLIK